MTTRLRRLAARVRSNPAQFVVSVVIAALLAGATWLAALATGAWGQSTRLETRASSLAIEELRHLYQDQAPQALEIAVMLVRADALAAASTEDGDLLAMESATLRKAAGELQLSLRRTDTLLSERYERPDGTYAVNERLADVLSQDPDITGQDVLTAVEEGDRLARTARWLCVLSVVAALTFVLVRLVGRRRRPVTGSARRAMRRRPGRPMPARTDDADADVGLVPQPWEQPDRPRRLIAAISLAAWLLLPILTGIQLALSMSSSRDDAEGGRRATTLTASLLASQLYQGFWSAARQSEVHSSMLGLARQFVATYGDDTDQAQLGVAETEAADQWTRIGVTMTRAPKLSDGVHARIVEMVNSSPDDHILLLEQQHAAVEAAQRRGDAGNLATLALLLVGLTATVTAWASPSGQRGPLATVGAISLVSSAAVLGIVAGWGGLA